MFPPRAVVTCVAIETGDARRCHFVWTQDSLNNMAAILWLLTIIVVIFADGVRWTESKLTVDIDVFCYPPLFVIVTR